MTIIRKLEALENAAGRPESTHTLQQQLDEFKATQLNDNRVCDEERANLRARVAALEARLSEPMQLQSFWIAEYPSRLQNVALPFNATVGELYRKILEFASSQQTQGVIHNGQQYPWKNLPSEATLLRDTVFTDADGQSLAVQSNPIYIYYQP